MASCFEPVLGGVGILEFVHQHVIETALPVCETLRMLREQRERKQQEVVEVHGVGLAERRAEARIDLRRHSLERRRDRKSTRLNSSHLVISYAVFCLKKKQT